MARYVCLLSWTAGARIGETYFIQQAGTCVYEDALKTRHASKRSTPEVPLFTNHLRRELPPCFSNVDVIGVTTERRRATHCE